ncbi:CDP-alcohol phosphatidyltransferase family protein [Streptomyces sp. NBC_00287]|uniref:CDP-alcohol phosphatidyltransferase family protein n=1 Tax=Streptomyces sp. NBC_00287 TaxID=2975702 RepID=UPI002E2A3365|nr:CDP-alcohol phosphatidyltransferase family protein [Streptomyces sp. NBC_00287]
MEHVSDMADSRAATNALLAGLREDNLAPGAAVRFLGQAAHRSLRQAAHRPRALAELTVLHGVLYALATGRRPGRRWVATSWALTVLHLGLLEHRTRLATADILTLTRANLPALPGGAGRASGVVAVGLDLADGRLARRHGTTSPFGDYADALADAAYWTWLTLRHEPSRTVRMAAVASWALPVATVTGLALRRGTMPERPRPVLLRPAAALQAVVALRHLTRR